MGYHDTQCHNTRIHNAKQLGAGTHSGRVICAHITILPLTLQSCLTIKVCHGIRYFPRQSKVFWRGSSEFRSNLTWIQKGVPWVDSVIGKILKSGGATGERKRNYCESSYVIWKKISAVRLVRKDCKKYDCKAQKIMKKLSIRTRKW